MKENFDPFVIVLLGSVDERATVHLGTGLVIAIALLLTYAVCEMAKEDKIKRSEGGTGFIFQLERMVYRYTAEQRGS